MKQSTQSLYALAAALFSLFMGVAPASAQSLGGFWMDSDGEVVLQIHGCGNAMCGKVAWLRLPQGPDGQLLTDYRNPDERLRTRPVCGLDVMTGFKRQPDGTWSEGTVYVSDLGKSFSGYAEVMNPLQVKVTGYIGLPMFGHSEVWSKVQEPFTPCWETPQDPAVKQVRPPLQKAAR